MFLIMWLGTAYAVFATFSGHIVLGELGRISIMNDVMRRSETQLFGDLSESFTDGSNG